MPPPVKRARAPTITVDTSAASDQPPIGEFWKKNMSELHRANNAAEPEITSAFSEDPNSLSVPGLRARGDSVNSHSSQSTTGSNTIVGSPQGSINQASDRSQTPISDEDVFKPESEEERALFEVNDSPFGVTPGHLGKLIPRKNIQALFLLHGLPGLAKGLRTDLANGLDVKE
jgi:Ca2+-transporting ATPase